MRGELRAERISTGELLELQSLAAHIAPGDVELLEAAGIPEHSEAAPAREAAHQITVNDAIRCAVGAGNVLLADRLRSLAFDLTNQTGVKVLPGEITDAPPAERDARCECDNCGWTGHESDMPDGISGIDDLYDRIDPGSEVPAGECPECHALAYVVEADNQYEQPDPVKAALLAALKMALVQIQQDNDERKAQFRGTEDQVRAAIAQAEGRQA